MSSNAEDRQVRKARLKLEKALEANRNEPAIALLQELCELEPKNARWPHKRGDLLRKLKRDQDAVACYAAAVDIYADQGFIARAIAMAKMVLNLDPSRIEILERVDPNAAQQLHRQQRATAAVPTRAHPMVIGGAPEAPKRHPMLVDDDPPQPNAPPPLPAPAAPAPAALRPPPQPSPGPAPRTARRRPITLDRLSLPPPVAALPQASKRDERLAPPRLPDAAEVYSRALGSVQELTRDPRAASNEVRFSDAPPRPGAIEVEISEDELTTREPVSQQHSLWPDPPTADKLSKLPLFPLFAEVPKEALADMIAEAELIELEHGAYVMRKGDRGDALYGIVEGSVVVMVPGQQLALTLAEGDVFGEACLLQDEKRHADVVVQGKLVALRIPREVLTRLLARHPRLAEVLLELLTRRLLGNLLQSSPLFQEFDAAGRRELARLFEIRRAPVGTMLAVLGKRMDGLYISLTGTLAINQPGAPERIGSPGSMFGQSTLLSNEPSQVDVTTRVNMVVLRLPAQAFTRMAMQYPTILARLAELSTSDVVKVTL